MEITACVQNSRRTVVFSLVIFYLSGEAASIAGEMDRN